MMVGNAIALLSLIVSGVSLFFLIRMDKKQKEENFKCYFNPNVFKGNNGIRYLQVKNIGKGVASNFMIECKSPYYYFQTSENQIPKILMPNQTANIVLSNHNNPVTYVDVLICWDEKVKKNKKVDFSIQIPFGC